MRGFRLAPSSSPFALPGLSWSGVGPSNQDARKASEDQRSQKIGRPPGPCTFRALHVGRGREEGGRRRIKPVGARGPSTAGGAEGCCPAHVLCSACLWPGWLPPEAGAGAGVGGLRLES